MKKLFTLFALMLCLTNLKAQFVTIPDANFVTWLQANIPSAMVGNQMDTTSLAVTTHTYINVQNLAISDLTGVQYFDSLKAINCANNQLSVLPTLPNVLLSIECSRNQLISLPLLPNYLKYIDCSHNQLTYLPPLPPLINNLLCDSNQLTYLPSLPNTLQNLYCSYNYLTTLPSLPNSLKLLYCSKNNLNVIPSIPIGTIIIDCSDNILTSLPPLPIGLNRLYCSNNQLNSLPTLPNVLSVLICAHNNISCLPILPNIQSEYLTFPGAIILAFDISFNPFNCLPNYIPAMNSGMLNYPLCSNGNINGCQNSRGITGYTYKDINVNCMKNLGDIGLKNIPIKLYNNSNNLMSQTYSAISGIYQFSQSANTYTVVIDTTDLPFTSSCLFPGLDSTVIVSTLDTNINFALTCNTSFDIGVQSIHKTGVILPGQNHVLNLNTGDITHWYNLNCQVGGISGSLSFSVNGPVTYIGPAAGALTPIVAGNVYTYNIADFGTINNGTDFQLIFQTNTTAQAGDMICVNATVTPISGDNNPSNNTYTFCYNVVNSYDPNIKETYPENVQPAFNDWLTYTIHFQNTGNAPAFNIRLADTLDTMLDLETFQVINYSHQNLIDLTGNVLNVRFPNIQLPDSATNSAESKGFIQYRVKPKATWVAPYQIKNTAYIYFDYNAPIITNTTLNTILIPMGIQSQTETVMNVYPNPSNGSFTIELNSKEKQSIQVFDITGNIVVSNIIENGKSIINANHLAAGIYSINIKGSSSVANKKMVIVK